VRHKCSYTGDALLGRGRHLSAKCQMATKLDDATIRKSYLDLWMHQNNLMWGRLQTLYIVQGAYFGVASFARGDVALLQIALLVVIVLSISISLIISSDRKIRNAHRISLLKVGIDPTPPKVFGTIYLNGRLPFMLWEKINQVIVFIFCILADLLAAVYLAK
jgi:hypothetical protein